MKDTPSVSVVIPAYNASQWIGETLQSVLDQDLADFEIIVIDDGSIDDTAQVVAAYGERIQCVHKQNGGASSARNVGILVARGEYIAFVDADDIWVKEKLRLQVDLLRRTGNAWAYSDAFAFDDETGNRFYRYGDSNLQYDGDILEPLFLANFIMSGTTVIRKSVFGDVGYFDETPSMRIGEDWDMWLRIAARYPVGLVSTPLAHYRIHRSSMTAGGMNPLAMLHGQLLVIEKAALRESVRLGVLKNQAMANCYVTAGRTLAVRGRIGEARRTFAHAIRFRPAMLYAYMCWVSTLIGPQVLGRLIQLNRLRRRYFGRMIGVK